MLTQKVVERHLGSIDTYEHIVPFQDAIPFSKHDGWGRFGILGVLGDMILQSLPHTHIIEIGTGESSIYLTELARRYNRRIFYCDEAGSKIENPMTIDGYLHEDTILLSGQPDELDYITHKGMAYHGTSDEFFKHIKFPPIGLAFIDGEHRYDFVKRDFENIYRSEERRVGKECRL